MFCSIKSLAHRRWIFASWAGALMVVVLAVVAAAAFRFGHLKGWAAYPVAVLPALPIAWVLVEMGRFLAQEKDEFQRNVLVQCLLGGTGGTLVTTTVWGYLEDFAHAPHLHLTLVYAIFWLFVVISYPVVRLKYR